MPKHLEAISRSTLSGFHEVLTQDYDQSYPEGQGKDETE